ncbi:MAG: tyrosine-type recombinase/integrase [Nitrosopumilaceae archaeon]|nr:phage integrase family protein [Nitrosopumilaceae archaeon]NIU01272.1 phage integrase family protein [Nitrosopumilaceae archaeon]NIU87620.1 tyrosine-type recombinase/integrase [Nitrosopumilaceae archaeon]NIV66045.1 tyrosine-type recombinase/integrase [Nitrosopumilaceae archaeon]NIX61874.1 tyrosine-type recombinase/integrase [Nitrosopumilaceae archaeon]
MEIPAFANKVHHLLFIYDFASVGCTEKILNQNAILILNNDPLREQLHPAKKGIDTFEEFCNQSSVQELILNLRGSKHHHTKPKSRIDIHSTQLVYANRLFHLHKWLDGRDFEFNNFVQTAQDTFQNRRESVTLHGLEHLLELYQNSFNSRRDFILLLKRYLNDQSHKGKRASSMVVEKSAILAYFRCNESEINITFDPKKRYKVREAEDPEPEMTLEDLLKLLTTGRPTLIQKAVILSKFHRGLDTTTLVDRFNFQAWGQLVSYFGTANYMKWDPDMCPVPIRLTRMKTDYSHVGFLDRDAVVAIQDYLYDEQKKKGRIPEAGKPLFVNQKGNAINVHWVSNAFNRMAQKAGIQSRLDGYDRKPIFSKNSHELRDLLESTLLNCGVRADVVEHVTGHKPKDSYEKQAKLFPSAVRAEYMKASNTINIFSNIYHYMKGDEKTILLENQVKVLKEKLEEAKNRERAIQEKG